VSGPSRHGRPVILRSLICQSCKALSNNTTEGIPSGFGFHSIDAVMRHIEQMKAPLESPPQRHEFLEICDTEGNAQNGGGTLILQEERTRGTCVKWIPERVPGRVIGGPGEIGSPIVGSSMLFNNGKSFTGPTGSIPALGSRLD
jgi:hypothetical protein